MRTSGRRRRIPALAVLLDLHTKSLKLRDGGLQRGDLPPGSGVSSFEAIQDDAISAVAGLLVNWQDHDRRIGHAAVLPHADGRQTTPDDARWRPGLPEAVDRAAGGLLRPCPLQRGETSYARTADHTHRSRARGTGLDRLSSALTTYSPRTQPRRQRNTRDRAWLTSRTSRKATRKYVMAAVDIRRLIR